MPYKLRKAPNRDLYWVINTDTGHKYSIEPIPKERAQKQMNLLRGVMHGFVPRLYAGEDKLENEVGEEVKVMHDMVSRTVAESVISITGGKRSTRSSV